MKSQNSHRPVAVFNFAHRWMQEMILQMAPPEFDVRFPTDANDPRQLQELLPRADFFVTLDLPAAWMPWLRRCKLVQHQGVGYDGIDLPALAAAGIPLAVTPEGTVLGVAEHTILFILALYKRLPAVHESLRRGEFDRIGWRPQCHFFAGKTLGVVGFGRIGQRVAHLARAFDVPVIYADVRRATAAVEAGLGARFLPFDRLLAEADIVSVHTPLTPETRGLFGAAEFARMKPGALFLNTARGGTYDMDALHEALTSGHLGGAGLDVFNPQPPPADHPILKLPNVILTPHMATGTVEAHLEKAQAQFANFQRVLRGEAPVNLVAEPLPQAQAAS
jgi:phosphoglycerate dehydrogenase-like enzyme